MSLSIIQNKLQSYNISSKQEEENALKEIYQEIALAGLARANFFKAAAFQGGTALRILYQLQRFSEDLDFVLINPSHPFQWKPYLDAIIMEFKSFGIDLETRERAKATTAIKTAFLKEDSFAKILELTYGRSSSDKQKIEIKLEIDVHPPKGSTYASHFLSYPYPFSIVAQDLPSLFASKCHALLCRKYDKGRDWFDLLWYCLKKVELNSTLLKNALYQTGPYKEQNIHFDKKWLINAFEEKIQSIDFKVAKQDVENFLRLDDRRFVQNWCTELFLKQIKDLLI